MKKLQDYLTITRILVLLSGFVVLFPEVFPDEVKPLSFAVPALGISALCYGICHKSIMDKLLQSKLSYIAWDKWVKGGKWSGIKDDERGWSHDCKDIIWLIMCISLFLFIFILSIILVFMFSGGSKVPEWIVAVLAVAVLAFLIIYTKGVQTPRLNRCRRVSRNSRLLLQLMFPDIEWDKQTNDNQVLRVVGCSFIILLSLITTLEVPEVPGKIIAFVALGLFIRFLIIMYNIHKRIHKLLLQSKFSDIAYDKWFIWDMAFISLLILGLFLVIVLGLPVSEVQGRIIAFVLILPWLFVPPKLAIEWYLCLG